MRTRPIIKKTYRIVFVILTFIGILINAFFSGANPIMMLSYYTIQSNLACLILMVIILIREHNHKPLTPMIVQVKAAFTAMIFLTFLVYHLLLRPVMIAYETEYDVLGYSDLLVHYVVPLMMLLDFVLFDCPIALKKTTPLKWIAIPGIYWVYTVIYALLGGRYVIGESVSRYPYFFMDFEELGFWMAVGLISVVAMGYIGIGYGLFGINQLGWKLTNCEKRDY